jgi:hypothetical protein
MSQLPPVPLHEVDALEENLLFSKGTTQLQMYLLVNSGLTII